MWHVDRRNMLEKALMAGLVGAPAAKAVAQTTSLSDVARAVGPREGVTIYIAKEIVTMDPDLPYARAVAVSGDRIVGVGQSAQELLTTLGGADATIDSSLSDSVIVPGFIAQHDHPMLAALTMASEVLAIEDWELPSGIVPAVKDRDNFIKRLTIAVEKQTDPTTPVLSWGYHPDFYGKLTKADLDKISSVQPIFVWARSCHEMILNSAAMRAGSVTPEVYAKFSASEKEQSNFDEARFWEQGMFALLPNIMLLIATPERLREGLLITRDYMHAKGITIGNEPGGVLAKPVQDGVNAVMSNSDMPFRWSFMVDAKSIVAANEDDAAVISATEGLASWYEGNTSFFSKRAKLFADGAIYSLLMQVREPYLDGHDGAWMMDKELFERAFRIYWDAGYQLHVHVNGDAGLDLVLDTLDANLKRNPREDHRTVIVHFAVSAYEQVQRIADLGAIVSGNPYYVSALADQYSKVGLGPVRAQSMVRLGDVERAGVSWSLHSDMPMAPADPLFLIWCAVNRITSSGKLAGADQKVTAEKALAGVTSEAAYSWKMEDEIGSIKSGMRANLTVLDNNPLRVPPMAIRDIKVRATVMEGRLMPVGMFNAGTNQDRVEAPVDREAFALASVEHLKRITHSHVCKLPHRRNPFRA